MSPYKPPQVGNYYRDRTREIFLYPVDWVSDRLGPCVIDRWFVGLRPWRRIKTGRWPVILHKFA